MCLLKDDMGTDDVTNMQLLICAKYPHTLYIALPWFTSIKKQGCCARYWRRSCFHAWLDAWLIFQMVASCCIWFLLQDKNRKFSARCEMFEAMPMGNAWHDAQVLDAWDYMWKHLMAKVAGLWHGCAWQSLTVNSLGNTVRLTFAWWKMAPCIRSALTCMMLTFCAWYYQRVLRETGAKTRETGAKRRETGAKKKCTTWPSCFDRHDVSRVFENPFYAWSEQKAWSEEKAPPCGLELVGGMLFQSEPSQSFHRTV